jgi:sugar lactone lactonase YvrE
MRAIAPLIVLMLIAPLSGLAYADSETPYKTFTVDGYGRMRETQTAYLPLYTFTRIGGETLNLPADLTVTDDGYLYVADAGNSRIVIGTTEGEFVGTMGEGHLVNPRGVFVADNKHVYVADRDAEAVFEFDENGALLNRYTKPASPLYGDTLSFLPIKVVVNKAGIMFIICESNTNGIVEISPTAGGTFLGYFGTNFAATDLRTIIYRAILTDAQRAKMVGNIPATPTNLAIDEDGLIYTVTRGDGAKTLKRLNIAGTNLFRDGAEWYAGSPTAVAAGNHDNVYVVEQPGFIWEYNNEGATLFVFGASDDGTQRVGLSSMIASITVDSNDCLYILDGDQGRIQVYEPTEFTKLLHNALCLYSKGRYTESKEPLTKILEMNSMFDYANRAMGRAYYQEENYETALRYARLAKDYDGYSDAFWEIRNIWLKKNIVLLIFVIAGLWLAFRLIRFWDRKKNILEKPRAVLGKLREKPLISNILYANYYMRHPIDGSYGIAAEGRGGWAAPSVILGAFMLEYVVFKYLCGFLQKTVAEGSYDFFSDFGGILAAMFALTVCNYLVCTINNGEANIKKIYTYFCYSLMPYILLVPVLFALSHVLAANELFVSLLLRIVIYAWALLLAVIGIKEVNNFTAGETAKTIFLTFFTMLIMALLCFIIYVLWAQVFEFVSSLVGEAVYRLGM